LTVLPPAHAPAPAPHGDPAGAVALWFDAVAEAAAPVLDGPLAAEHAAAQAFQRMAKADNTCKAYRAAVRAWCTWCDSRGRPALPAAGPDVAAFLAAERHRGLTPNSIDLRRAAIRYLHHAAGCPVPTDDACVAETVAGIRRDAARKGELPAKKAAATAAILRQILAPIPTDFRGLRDRALILTGFAGALRRSELAAIRVEQLEKTARGLRLTLPQTKGSQAEAVIVPLPYGQSELCPVRALTTWLEAAGIAGGPLFRRLWLPKKARPDAPPPLPRLGSRAITPWAIAAIVKARAAEAGFGGPQAWCPDDGHGTRRPSR
jgi:integrase